jgi:hypothetical protein
MYFVVVEYTMKYKTFNILLAMRISDEHATGADHPDTEQASWRIRRKSGFGKCWFFNTYNESCTESIPRTDRPDWWKVLHSHILFSWPSNYECFHIRIINEAIRNDY